MAENCELCGEPLPEGEEMFKYHGYSGPCPKPPLPRPPSQPWKKIPWKCRLMCSLIRQVKAKLSEREAGKHLELTIEIAELRAALRAERKREMKLNVNDNVWVRLTPHGEKMWADHWNRYKSPKDREGVPACIRQSRVERDGRVRFQIHELMNIFGEVMYNGSSDQPFEANAIWTECDWKPEITVSHGAPAGVGPGKP